MVTENMKRVSVAALVPGKGLLVGELDLLPVDRSQQGFCETDSRGQNVSSWGEPILADTESQLWHGFVSEIQDGCGNQHSKSSHHCDLAVWNLSIFEQSIFS